MGKDYRHSKEDIKDYEDFEGDFGSKSKSARKGKSKVADLDLKQSQRQKQKRQREDYYPEN